MPIRLACQLPSGARPHLLNAIIRRESRKGKTLEYLMVLARENADHPVMQFDNSGKSEPCTLNVPETWLRTFLPYRNQHGIYQNTQLFMDTILRGLSREMAIAEEELNLQRAVQDTEKPNTSDEDGTKKPE